MKKGYKRLPTTKSELDDLSILMRPEFKRELNILKRIADNDQDEKVT